MENTETGDRRCWNLEQKKKTKTACWRISGSQAASMEGMDRQRFQSGPRFSDWSGVEESCTREVGTRQTQATDRW